MHKDNNTKPADTRTNEEIGNALAVLLEHELSSDLNNAIERHLRSLFELSNFSSPAIARRLYPILKQLADDQAQEHGMTYSQWESSNQLILDTVQ